jgi:2-hydroxychromene-2-carboxylate isomerase
MGELISLAERRAARAEAHAPPVRPRVSFCFDLASPWTYLAAERVDQRFAEVRWQPAVGEALPGARDLAGQRRAVEERAAELQLPLVWPEAQPAAARSAMRVAALAADRGRAAEFVLAASRLAFCGGYDVDDPEILADAAAAGDLGLDECLRAAGELRRDGPMERSALRLLAQGADALPVLIVGRTLFCGEHRLSEAAAAFSGRRAAPPPARRTFGG